MKDAYNPIIRTKNAPTMQWVKFAVAAVCYVLFIAWLHSWWWLLLLPIIYDLYITKYIPWSFWKKTKNKQLYSLFSWIDAIVFALVAVYFINLYLFQNYKIPSSSLEKSLLVGDYLFVSKVAYGPRVPRTPLSFPLTQHTLPILNCKSFLENPQWPYRRLAGLDTIKRLDIVVFNFPTGDTVATLMPNPDYYTLCNYVGRENVWNHPEQFGEIVYRPVDRRENYVKRCVGLPGDTLQIIDNQVYINSQAQHNPRGLQTNYWVITDGRTISDAQFEKIGVSVDDRFLINRRGDGNAILRQLQIPLAENGQFYPTYMLPLTAEALEKIKTLPNVLEVRIDPGFFDHNVFPIEYTHWTRDNYGPVYIPRKGATVTLTEENLPLYRRIIDIYENNDLEVRDHVIYINGKAAKSYTFQMNYYWMMGDNRHNSEDSRFWGFVPEDHIIGKPLFVWLSLDKDQSGFKAIRWSRFFKWVDNIR